MSVVLFNGFKDHEFMSFSRSIGRAFPKAVELGVFEIGEFLETRMQQSKLLWTPAFVQNWLRRGTSSANKLYTDRTENFDQFLETC